MSTKANLGDFAQAVDDAIMGSSEAHQNQMIPPPQIAQGFARVVFDMLYQQKPSINHMVEGLS